MTESVLGHVFHQGSEWFLPEANLILSPCCNASRQSSSVCCCVCSGVAPGPLPSDPPSSSWGKVCKQCRTELPSKTDFWHVSGSCDMHWLLMHVHAFSPIGSSASCCDEPGTAWNSSRQRRSSQPCSLRWSSLSSAAPFRQGSLQERRRWHPAACRFVPWLPETELRPHEIDSLRTLHAKWLWEWGWHVFGPSASFWTLSLFILLLRWDVDNPDKNKHTHIHKICDMMWQDQTWRTSMKARVNPRASASPLPDIGRGRLVDLAIFEHSVFQLEGTWKMGLYGWFNKLYWHTFPTIPLHGCLCLTAQALGCLVFHPSKVYTSCW